MTDRPASARPAMLRRFNERRVLQALQQRGELSRAEIARVTGVSGPTVTRAVAGLLAAGLLEEGDVLRAGLGRPGRVLRLASSNAAVLGMVVEAAQCEVFAAGLDGRVREPTVRRLDTPPDYRGLVSALAEAARTVRRETGVAVKGLGISVPGLLDSRDGRTVFAANLPQTNGRQLGEDLSRRLRLPAIIQKESHALCLAEQGIGAAQGINDFALLDISEGLGLGVVEGGRLLSGSAGLAGEFGHITVQADGRACGCGNRGCLETVATDRAFSEAVSRRVGRLMTVSEIIDEVRGGRLNADEELAFTLEYLAIGVAAVVNLFNPTRLFIYGRMLDVADGLFDRLVELAAGRALTPSMRMCTIIRARGSKRAGAVAGIVRRLTTDRCPAWNTSSAGS